MSSQEGRAKWVEINEVSPHLINATIIAEDKRFFFHPGVDPIAVIRAVYTNFKKNQIVSGGSTITQQLIRIISPRKRTLFAKIVEALSALRVELSLSKKEILEQYLNRAPYGNQLFGIEAASQMYFAKPALDLSIKEAAFLAILPRAPSAYDPYKHPEKIKRLHDKLIKDIYDAGRISDLEYEIALKTSLKLSPKKWPFRAPHFVEMLTYNPFAPNNGFPFALSQSKGDNKTIRTSLDIKLQSQIERIVKANLRLLEKFNVTNAAVVVLDNKTGEILSLVGSKDYFDDKTSGNVNGATSRRQPGSALKPFTYALALDNGYTAASILPDIELQFPTEKGDYIPRNYDRKYRGPVRLRVALANSLNVPAVYLVSKLGEQNLLSKLHELDFESLDREPSYYGLGLTLGNGEVTLLELAAAYMALARGGNYITPTSAAIAKNEETIKPSPGKRIFSEETAYIISDILSDAASRRMTFGEDTPLNLPFKAAAKTGTSKNFRDNWTVGYTPELTVAVWVGNFDGSPMHGVSGITGAGPIFRDVFEVAAKGKEMKWFKRPNKIVEKKICPFSGELIQHHCTSSINEIFSSKSIPKQQCSFHEEDYVNLPHEYEEWAIENNLRLPPKKKQVHRIGKKKEEGFIITHPRNNSVYFIDPYIPRELQNLHLKANSNDEVEWFVNGEKVTSTWPLKEGNHQFRASSKDKNHADEIQITVYK